MSRKIPNEKLLVDTIKDVINRRGSVQSQEEFRYLVLRSLKKIDKNYSLSNKRLKSNVLKINDISIKAKTKKMTKIQKLERCPVCNLKIKKLFEKNLFNNEIHIGYICKRCRYKTDLESFMPLRYIFLLKENS